MYNFVHQYLAKVYLTCGLVVVVYYVAQSVKLMMMLCLSLGIKDNK